MLAHNLSNAQSQLGREERTPELDTFLVCLVRRKINIIHLLCSGLGTCPRPVCVRLCVRVCIIQERMGNY